MSITVKFKKLHPAACVPEYMTTGAAGADVYAVVEEPQGGPLVIKAGEHRLVRTGLALEVPPGYEMQIRPRSSLALKQRVTVLNSPSTIDNDYRGEVGIVLVNHGENAFFLYGGERIAQFVLQPVFRAAYEKADELSATDRGAGGFGSTGK